MFGNRLIRETGNVVFQDPAFRTDLINFIHNCTTYDLIDGTLDPAVFSASDDVWPLMASPNPARFSTLTGAGGSVGVDTCPNVYPVSYTHLDVYKRQEHHLVEKLQIKNGD